MLTRTHELLEQGVYDVDQFLDRSRSLTLQIENTEKVLGELSSELYNERQRESSKINIIPKVERLLEVYSELPSAQAKNDMLKEVLEKASITERRGPRKVARMIASSLSCIQSSRPIENT